MHSEAIPSLLAGRYETQELLDSNDDSCIVTAVDRLRPWCSLVAKIAWAASPTTGRRERLRHEYGTLVDLVHPHLPRAFDYGSEEAGYSWMILGRAPGQPLDRLGLLPRDEAITMVAGVCRALLHLHRRGLVHYDVKPGNIIWDARQRHATLVDLDLSGPPTVDAGRGTLPYAAPEVLTGGEVSGRSDLFSLGVTLHEVLLGEPLGEEADPYALDLGEGLGEAFQLLVRELTQKKPLLRPVDALEVIRRLPGGEGAMPDEARRAWRTHLQRPPAMTRANAEPVLRLVTEGRLEAPIPAVFVSGDSGVGKTRFLEHLSFQWRVAGYRVLEIDPVPNGTLAPIVRFLGRLDDQPELDVRELYEADGPGDWQGIFARLAQELITKAATQPSVLVLEDVHRYDLTSRSFLLHFLRHLGSSRREVGRGHENLAGVVLSYHAGYLRDHELVDFLQDDASSFIHRIEIPPLDRRGVKEFLQAIAGPTQVPSSTVEQIEAATGGNLLMIRELLLAEAPPKPGGFPSFDLVAGEGPRNSSLPRSLQHFVKRRIEALAAPERSALQYLSLFPRGAAPSELEGLVGDAVGDACAGLLDAQLVDEFDGVYQFRDATTRRVVRASLAPDERRRLHDRLASHLEREGGPREEIAWHLLRGTRPRLGLGVAMEVVPWLLGRASEEEAILILESVRSHESLSYFAARWASLMVARTHVRRGELGRAGRRLETLVEAAPRDLNAVLELARIRRKEGRLSEARALVEELTPPSFELGRLNRLAIRFELAQCLLDIGYSDEVWKLLEEATKELTPLVPKLARLRGALPEQEDLVALEIDRADEDETRAVARYLELLADASQHRRDPRRSLWCQMSVVRLWRRLGDERGHARALHSLGTTYMRLEEYAVAEANFERALEKRQWLGDLTGAAETANNLGVLMRRTGRLEEAKSYFSRCLEWVQRTGHARAEVNARLNLANIHNATRELAEASREYHRALEVARRVGDRRSQAQILNNLGTVASSKDLHGEAIHCYEQARRLEEELGNESSVLVKCLNLAEEYTRLGLPDEASRLLDHLRARLGKDGSDALHRRLLLSEARLHRLLGDHEEALEFYRRLLLLFADGGDDEGSRGIAAEMAELQLDLGDPKAAEEALGTRPRGAEEELSWVIARARLLLARGDDDERAGFVTELEESIRFARRANLLGRLFDLLRHRANFALDAEDLQGCQEAQTEALEALEAIAFSISDRRMLRAFLETRRVSEFRDSVERFSARLREGSSLQMMPVAEPVFMRLRDALFDAQRRLGPAGHGHRGEVAIRRILEATRSLRSTAPLEDLLRDIVDQIVAFSRAERGFLITVDPRGRQRIALARDASEQSVPHPEGEVSRRIVQEVLRSGRSIRLSDARTANAYTTRSVVNLDLRSVMCAPLVHGGKTIGLLYVDNRSRKGQFTGGDLELLDVFAAQAAIALENARLTREFARDERLKVMGNMAAGVAHGFNNILARILGRAQEMAVRCQDPALLAGIAEIEQAAREGAAVVEDLQEATHRRERRARSIALASLISEIIQVTRYRWEGEALRRGARIEVEARIPDDITVRGNAVELQGVFTDLLLHSVEAIRDGGKVLLSAELRGAEVALSLQDSGATLPREVRDHLFDPFLAVGRQGEEGIGLSAVHDVITAHDGAISVMPTEEGEGTRVVVTLPAMIEGREAAPIAKPQETASNTGPSRVLVVDDEPGVLELLGEFLGREGFQVRSASDGLEALEILRGFEPEVVLTDLGMAPLNGWDLAAEVKQLHPGAKVILLTGWGSEIEESVARERNVDRIMTKPFELAAIRQAIREVSASGDGAVKTAESQEG